MKNPYSFGRLAVYAALAVALGAGASACPGGEQESPKCTQDRDGNTNCPLQTGRQDR